MNRAIVVICAVLAFVGLMELCKAINENANEIAETLPMITFLVGICTVGYVVYKLRE